MTRLPVFTLLIYVTVFPAFAANEIGWDDLEPVTNEVIEDPFLELSDEQLMSLSMVDRYGEILKVQGELSVAGQEELEQETEKLVEWGVDIDGLIAKRLEIIEQRMRQGAATNPELDGMSVKIPGYLLPLEFEDEKVMEFLLVPYVGACIHTPPPPPNQIVHVTSEYGFMSSNLYAPVWVEGVIKNESGETALSYIDGSSDIQVAYKLDASEVTLYQ